jgi:hypothetical protein
MFLKTNFITCEGSPISVEFAFKAIINEIVRILREKGDFLSASEMKRLVNITSRPDCTPFEGNTIIIYKKKVDILDSQKRDVIQKKTKELFQNMLDRGYFTYGEFIFSL